MHTRACTHTHTHVHMHTCARTHAHAHTHTHTTQDGVTADEVAEVNGHHAVCEELRKHMHGDPRPLNKVSRTS